MKHISALCAVVLVAGALACGGGVTLPPVQPEDVEIFMPGVAPMEDYEVLARIEDDASLDTPDQELIDRAKARAAQLGADAVLITSIRQTTEGQIDTDLSREQRKIIEALAVYFPAQHPELQEQG